MSMMFVGSLFRSSNNIVFFFHLYVFDGMPGLCTAFSMPFLLAVYVVFDLSQVNNN
jgi:hypothetical protein